MTQWHPIFDELLRKTLQDYYEVLTNMPVGDLPREADIVLVRRASTHKPPFQTLWKHLSRWNVLEFKGRSESARVEDVDLLAEVGLGIHRRLQEQEPKAKIGRNDISFWYLANRLGKRFLRDVIELTGELEPIGSGLWRGRLLGRPLWLVSNGDVAIDVESAPVSVVSHQSAERALQLAEVVMASDELWQTYGRVLIRSFPDWIEEFTTMAARIRRENDDLGVTARKIIAAASAEQLEKAGATQEHIEKIGLDGLLAALTPEQRQELAKRIEAAKK